MTENKDKIISLLYQQGVTVPVIAQMTQLTEEEVHSVVKDERKYFAGPYNRGRPNMAERDKAICEAYTNGKGNATSLGKEYGLTRERVCQILRRQNLIELVVERKKLAREIIADDKVAEKAAVLAKLKHGEALVAEGKSISAAAVEANVAPAILQNYMKRHSKVKSLHGRWRDFQPRIDRFLALRKAGHTMVGAIQIMNAEGDKIHSAWVYTHGVDKLVKKPKKEKPHGKNSRARGR